MDTPQLYAKFEHPDITAKGETRAHVALKSLETLWFNTGSLCNLNCQGCYMESSPTNDRLAYIRLREIKPFLDEIAAQQLPVREIGFTGGEPFMNPEIIEILESCLFAGFEVLVLSNAMKPLQHKKKELLSLKERFGDQLGFRVSIDHYKAQEHDKLRGAGSWKVMTQGLVWLAQNDFRLAIAGRTIWQEDEHGARSGYAKMLKELGVSLDTQNPAHLVLFPEMDEQVDVPEITVACWDILGLHPDAMMCATSRMVVKHKDALAPMVMPCTLLPYDASFKMGETLADGDASVKLNHPHCAKFCVLGGGSCSQS